MTAKLKLLKLVYIQDIKKKNVFVLAFCQFIMGKLNLCAKNIALKIKKNSREKKKLA